jgi:hypothetical protein
MEVLDICIDFAKARSVTALFLFTNDLALKKSISSIFL